MISDSCPLCGQLVSRNGWGRSRHLEYHRRQGHIRRARPPARGWRMATKGCFIARVKPPTGRHPVPGDILSAFRPQRKP